MKGKKVKRTFPLCPPVPSDGIAGPQALMFKSKKKLGRFTGLRTKKLPFERLLYFLSEIVFLCSYKTIYLCRQIVNINMNNKIMMNRKLTIVGMVAAALLMAAPVMAQKPTVPNSSYTGKGNPILPDFHADPEILYSNKTKKYYIYSTTDGTPGWGGWQYYCYSSKNLKKWKNEGVVLDAKSDQISWANGNLWAPAAVEVKQKDGSYKYYLYFSARPNDNGRKQMGVAVADSPTGPFVDLGHPLLAKNHPGCKGQLIDVDVFIDPVSKKPYLYWGNSFMAGAELEPSMTKIKDETVTVMTPKGGSLRDYAYREAPYVFYRNGLYYFMWSVDDTGAANYHVAYGTSKSPLGPIEVAKDPIVLIQDPQHEIYGTAHNSVIQKPGTDEWYIVYHRINKDYIHHQPGVHREVCIDKMEFNADGTIKRVIPTHKGI